MQKITLKKIQAIWALAREKLGCSDILVSVYRESEEDYSSDSENRHFQVIAEGVLTPEETFSAICCNDDHREIILWFESNDGSYWRAWLSEVIGLV